MGSYRTIKAGVTIAARPTSRKTVQTSWGSALWVRPCGGAGVGRSGSVLRAGATVTLPAIAGDPIICAFWRVASRVLPPRKGVPTVTAARSSPVIS